MTKRLVADAVFTVDAHNRVFRPGAVEFDDHDDHAAHAAHSDHADTAGLITWVGDPRTTPAAAGTVVTELGGVIMPGLVNCHGHSPMTLLRSAGDGLPLERWLAEAIWPREALHSDEDVFWGMTLGASELLLNGVTTTSEQYMHAEAVAEAVLASGIRCVLTPAVFDMPGVDAEGAWQAHLATACRIFDEMDGRENRLHVGFGPHGAYSLSPEGLTAVAQEAQRRHALVQIHLAETQAEGAMVQERYGMRAPALLASLGVLDGPVLAAHSIWLDDTDLDVLAEHDVAVAHCPGSNGKLGSGVARLPEILARGIRVGLGTDGPASNDDLHLWDEMRLAAIMARATMADPGVISTATALRLGTRGGGEALGLNVGSLEAGRQADVIRLRTDDARFVPALNEEELLGHLVWAGAGYLVTDVWVGGRAAVLDGRCLHIDAARARAEVEERAHRLFAT